MYYYAAELLRTAVMLGRTGRTTHRMEGVRNTKELTPLLSPELIPGGD